MLSVALFFNNPFFFAYSILSFTWAIACSGSITSSPTCLPNIKQEGQINLVNVNIEKEYINFQAVKEKASYYL